MLLCVILWWLYFFIKALSYLGNNSKVESLSERQGCLRPNTCLHCSPWWVTIHSHTCWGHEIDFIVLPQYWVSSQKCTNIWWKTIPHWWLKLLINETECFPLWMLPNFVASFVNCLIISFSIIFLVLFFSVFNHSDFVFLTTTDFNLY